ncbi:winged helix-turn-helix transcriptional regulator [Nocardiopsis ganjiahuensis]|uniref:winged helix-turn-helix transcriptional regulator n=1 Tax=Nocardiopsis ganjiahuensis TaxID=239984 RepID=UPI001EF9DC34|nr:helix-turn-helix domain-containing protein [Nocardiopsis ganjiahuensis]
MDDAHGCYEFIADCRLREAASLFAHTWDPTLLAALSEGPLRRRALRSVIGGISDKALTESLHRLLDSGMVERRSYRQAPPRVDYALTALGRSFVDGPVRALADWTREHADTLAEARLSGRP